MNTGIVVSDIRVRVKRTFRNRQVLLWLVLVPVIMTFVCQAFMMALDSEDVAKVYVQDLDGSSTYGSLIIEEMEKNFDVEEVSYREDTAAAIQEAFGSNPDQTIVFLVIPHDFDKYVLKSFTQDEFKTKLDTEGSEFVISLLSNGSSDYRDGMPHVAVRTPTESKDSALDNFRSLTGGKIYQIYLPCQLVVILMLVSNGLILGAICMEKVNRVSAINRYTKMGRREMVLSLMLSNLVPSVICIILVILISMLFSHLAVNLYLIPCFLLVSFSITAFGLLVSEFAKDPQSCNIASVAVTLPMILLSGCLFPDGFLPDWFMVISDFMPLTYMINVMKIGTGASVDVLSNILILLLFTGLLLAAWYLLDKRKQSGDEQ